MYVIVVIQSIILYLSTQSIVMFYIFSKRKVIAFKNVLLSFKGFCKLSALLKSSCGFLIAVLRCLMAMNDISPCTVWTRFLCYCLKIQDGHYFSKVNTIRAIFFSLSLSFFVY